MIADNSANSPMQNDRILQPKTGTPELRTKPILMPPHDLARATAHRSKTKFKNPRAPARFV
jgi:hypothetical protein